MNYPDDLVDALASRTDHAHAAGAPCEFCRDEVRYFLDGITAAGYAIVQAYTAADMNDFVQLQEAPDTETDPNLANVAAYHARMQELRADLDRLAPGSHPDPWGLTETDPTPPHGIPRP